MLLLHQLTYQISDTHTNEKILKLIYMKAFTMMTTEDVKRIKEQTDLPLLIEHYRKEICERKQKECIVDP